eukprot:COSAG03_NODE_9_length_23924_cov_40.675690_25_plen_143_part_00
MCSPSQSSLSPLASCLHTIGMARSSMLNTISPVGSPVFLQSKSVTLAAVIRYIVMFCRVRGFGRVVPPASVIGGPANPPAYAPPRPSRSLQRSAGRQSVHLDVADNAAQGDRAFIWSTWQARSLVHFPAHQAAQEVHSGRGD